MPFRQIDRTILFKVALVALSLQLVCAVSPVVLLAQRPFFANDPLYRDETARRTYYDGYAVSGEVSYRPIDPIYTGGAASLGVLFRADYEVTSQFDVSAIVDAFGGPQAQSMRLAWIAVKHHWHSEGADMAVRVAFEPRPPIGGGIGFRQTDVGFFYSKVLSPTVETVIALGLRHVRTGFQSQTADFGYSVKETRGFEAHLVLGYNLIFDPARSHISLSLGYEGGRYDVTDRVLPPSVPSPGLTNEFAGHVLWIQTGLHWYRPTYQLVPFVRVPLAVEQKGDGPTRGKGPRYVNVGFRVTIR